MKNPLDYNKAMFCAQGFAMVLYVTISVSFSSLISRFRRDVSDLPSLSLSLS